MFEGIEIAATIIGIIGAIWAFVKFVFNPFFKKREEYKNICNVVNDSYERWKELGYTVRGGSMVSHDDFLIVNKYRSKFKNRSPEIKAYLLRNAIQNGLGGNWGFWINMNKDNKLILLHLFLSLDKSGGLRPAWRSAYILEKIYANKSAEIDKFVAENEKFHLTQKYFLDIIKSNSVEKELQKLSRKGTKEEKEKLKFIEEEILRFSKQVNDFVKYQTIVI